MSQNTKNILMAIVASAALSGGGAWYLAKKETSPSASGAAATKPGGAAVAMAVEAYPVETVSLPQGVTSVGSLRSDESVTIRSEISGRISQIGFKEGQKVVKGAVLFRLDSAVDAAEVAQAKANLVLSQSKYNRAVDLKEKGFISQQARDEAENNLQVAEAAAQLAEARYAKTIIRAPFGGIIGLRQVSIGDYVKEGQDMVNLEAVDLLKVDFRVPEIYLRQVRPDQTLQINLDAFPDKEFAARVYAINPLVDQAGRSIVIRAQVSNAEAALRPGMFARVRLFFNAHRETLVVPEQALVPEGEDRYVFKIENDEAKRVKVEIGQRQDGNVEIVKGLVKGDVVVTAGQMKLRDGAAVKVARPELKDGGVSQEVAKDGNGKPAEGSGQAAGGKT